MTTYDSDGKWIDTMQICKNGHVINDSYGRFPEKTKITVKYAVKKQ